MFKIKILKRKDDFINTHYKTNDINHFYVTQNTDQEITLDPATREPEIYTVINAETKKRMFNISKDRLMKNVSDYWVKIN